MYRWCLFLISSSSNRPSCFNKTRTRPGLAQSFGVGFIRLEDGAQAQVCYCIGHLARQRVGYGELLADAASLCPCTGLVEVDGIQALVVLGLVAVCRSFDGGGTAAAAAAWAPRTGPGAATR